MSRINDEHINITRNTNSQNIKCSGDDIGNAVTKVCLRIGCQSKPSSRASSKGTI